MKVEHFDGMFWAQSGNALYGPFDTAEAAETWYVGKGPLAIGRRNLDPMGRPYVPPAPRKARTVPNVPLPVNPRRKGPPEPRYGDRGFEEAQWGWARRRAVLRAYRTGSITQAKLAEFMGFSTGFIAQLIARAEREELTGRKAPFSLYSDRNIFDATSAREFVQHLDRSVALARAVGRDWIFVSRPGNLLETRHDR